jgi:hypothetical protein
VIGVRIMSGHTQGTQPLEYELHLPEAIVPSLEDEGLVVRSVSTRGSVTEGVTLALLVANTAATTITLAEGPDVLKKVLRRLTGWAQTEDPSCTVTWKGPNGEGEVRLLDVKSDDLEPLVGVMSQAFQGDDEREPE